MANRKGNSDRFSFGEIQNHCRWWPKTWNEKMLAPWKKSYDQPSCCCCCLVESVVSDSVRSHRLWPARLPCPGDYPRQEHWSGLPFPFECMKVKVKSFIRVRPFATPWTAAYQAPPSLGFSRQEYWSGNDIPIKLLKAFFVELDKWDVNL